MKISTSLFAAALSVALSSMHAAETVQTSTTTTTEAIPAPNTPDGFTILNGRVYFIRSGQMMPLEDEVTLRVSPTGTVTAFDGHTYAIPHGQVLTLAAGVTALPAGSSSAAATSSTVETTAIGSAGGEAVGTSRSSGFTRDRGNSSGSVELFTLGAGTATTAAPSTNGRRPLAGETRDGTSTPANSGGSGRSSGTAAGGNGTVPNGTTTGGTGTSGSPTNGSNTNGSNSGGGASSSGSSGGRKSGGGTTGGGGGTGGGTSSGGAGGSGGGL